MCGICGCDAGEARIDGNPSPEAAHLPLIRGKTTPASHDHGHAHDHGHGHDHSHSHDHHSHRNGHGHAPQPSGIVQITEREHLVAIEQGILSKNDGFAAVNRARFAKQGMLALNFVSSPGAGKTSLLVATIEGLKHELPIAVIEGDQETENDAERIRATGIPAVQINTGRGCHLDAHMVGHALDGMTIQQGSLLLIENVGNLVCPASFDLGEAHKVAILSVTEGEDKPIKYPDMFAAARVLVISKIDLLPYLRFDLERALEHARRVNPTIEVVRLSTETGEGMPAWLEMLRRQVGAARAGLPSEAGQASPHPAMDQRRRAAAV